MKNSATALTLLGFALVFGADASSRAANLEHNGTHMAGTAIETSHGRHINRAVREHRSRVRDFGNVERVRHDERLAALRDHSKAERRAARRHRELEMYAAAARRGGGHEVARVYDAGVGRVEGARELARAARSDLLERAAARERSGRGARDERGEIKEISVKVEMRI